MSGKRNWDPAIWIVAGYAMGGVSFVIVIGSWLMWGK